GRCEDAGIPPARAGQIPWLLGYRHRSHIDDIHNQEIPGFGTLHAERSRKGVTDVEGGSEDVLGGFVVTLRAVEPVATVDAEGLPGPDGLHRGDLRMPPVWARGTRMVEGLGWARWEERFGHGPIIKTVL